MQTDVSLSKPTFEDSFLAGVRQHLEAVGRNLEACEMMEIGEKMHFDLCGRVGASLVGKDCDDDVVQPDFTGDGSRQLTLLLPAFSDREQHILPTSASSNFPYQLPGSETSAVKICQGTMCGEQFSSYGLHSLHQRLHLQEAPVRCTACRRRFSRASDLSRHSCRLSLKDHGILKQKYSDQNCFGKVKTDRLRGQMRSCRLCQKQFRSNSHLTRHMQVHTGERPHQCSICEKRFSEPSSVKRHMYIHTNEAPHACPTCGHRFSSPCYLREHMLSHTGERPNKCPVCEKQYSRLGHLTRHLRQHTRAKQLEGCESGKSGCRDVADEETSCSQHPS